VSAEPLASIMDRQGAIGGIRTRGRSRPLGNGGRADSIGSAVSATAFNAPLRWSLRQGAFDASAAGRLLLLTATVLVTALASIEFTRSSDSIAALWPANAIVVAALLRTNRGLTRNRQFMFLGSLAGFVLAHLAAGDGVLLSTTLPLACMSEVAAAVWLVNRFIGGAVDLGRVRTLTLFVLLAGGIAPVVGATIGATAVSAADWLPWGSTWLVWYAADALGMVVVAPFALSLRGQQWRALHMEKRIFEALAVLALVLVAAAFASFYRPLIFLVVPVVFLATVRFGIVGAATSTFVVALVATMQVVQGVGTPLLPESSFAERILTLQIFLAITALWSLPVAAVLSERGRLLGRLHAGKTRAERDSESKSRTLVTLRRRLANAEEHERLRLARELHDQTGQDLIASMLELREIESLVGEDGRDRVHRLRQKLERIGGTLHRIAWELRPAAIDDLGLASAIESHLRDWSTGLGVEADFHCANSAIDDLADDVCTTIFRVMQEALTNIAKHATGATNVSVVIDRAANVVQLTIEDDGCGFAADRASEIALTRTDGGLGLAGMHERLSLIDGELKIESSPGAGTTLVARIQLDGQGADS
jgi:signal transduction histidine kinase